MRGSVEGMNCPVDGAALVMSERSGIEIDYCPTCRGVWLDRGELDKIIERSAAQGAPLGQSEPHRSSSPWPEREQDRGYGQGSGGYGQRKRKKSFLEELFD
jgi:uncharacterized protein